MTTPSSKLVLISLALAIALVPQLAGGTDGDIRVLFDFDSAPASDIDLINGQSLQVDKVPRGPKTKGIGPNGNGVWICAGDGTTVQMGDVPVDWTGFRSVGFWIYRSPEEADRHPTLSLEVRVAESAGRAWHWRRVDVSSVGWAQVELPLRWFRRSEGHPPTLADVDSLALYFRNGAEVVVDAVYVREGDSGDGTQQLDDLAPVAFPGTPADQVRALETDRVRLLTDAAGLDLEQLAAHLGEVHDRVLAEMPFLDEPEAVLAMIVFADEDEYRRFPGRLGDMICADARPPSGPGFTLEGIATSTWDDRYGTLRPVYTHEYTHALVEASTGLRNGSEWFHEGIAGHFQLQFHPEDGGKEWVAAQLADRSRQLTLSRLCSGHGLDTKQYWQAVLVFELLLANDEYRAKLPDLVEAFVDAGSTNIDPLIEPVLGSTRSEFADAYAAYCLERYGVDLRAGE